MKKILNAIRGAFSDRDIFLLLAGAIVHILAVVFPMPTAAKCVFTTVALVLLMIKCGGSYKGTAAVMKICLASAIGMITVCSKSSFLYPLNDWVDSNCFFTVGKSMMNGLVVYRDLLEQKGPFLYALHAVAWLISKDTFAGVYLIEVWAAAFFLFYSHRAIRLICDSDWTLVLIPFMAAAIYTSQSFSYGDSVEELSLPLLAYAMWIGMDALQNGREITRREYFLIGLTSGLIFWSKFTLVGYYLGWFLFPAAEYVRRGRWKELLRSVGIIVCGVAAATIPFVIYFGINGAIGDWLTVYLYDNLFRYTVGPADGGGMRALLKNMLGSVMLTVRDNTALVLLSLMGVWYYLCKRSKTALFLVVTAAFTVVFAFIGGRYFSYYPFVIAVFAPYGFLLLPEPLINQGTRFPHTRAGIAVLAVLLAFSTVFSSLFTPNRYLKGAPKEEMPQYKFASIIGTDGTATLLNYGFLDGGFYTVTNTIPNCKVFCRLNLDHEQMKAIQDTYLEEELVEYVVTRNEELTCENYECISSSTYIYVGSEYTYYLYRLKG